MVLVEPPAHANITGLSKVGTEYTKYFHSLIVPIDSVSEQQCHFVHGDGARRECWAKTGEAVNACLQKFDRRLSECYERAKRIPECRVTITNGKEELVCEPAQQ